MESVLRSLWIRSWSEDLDVHTPDDLTAVGATAGMGEDEIADCLAAMKTDSVKSALKVRIYSVESLTAYPNQPTTPPPHHRNLMVAFRSLRLAFIDHN